MNRLEFSRIIANCCADKLTQHYLYDNLIEQSNLMLAC